ncbi:Uncharacterised protein [uncultured archaeon]|nr:Uncharacterised protein [uncultured archaeon]
MAKIVENRVTVVLSRMVPDNAIEVELDPVLSNDQLNTLQDAIVSIVDNSAVVVEIANKSE